MAGLDAEIANLSHDNLGTHAQQEINRLKNARDQAQQRRDTSEQSFRSRRRQLDKQGKEAFENAIDSNAAAFVYSPTLLLDPKNPDFSDFQASSRAGDKLSASESPRIPAIDQLNSAADLVAYARWVSRNGRPVEAARLQRRAMTFNAYEHELATDKGLTGLQFSSAAREFGLSVTAETFAGHEEILVSNAAAASAKIFNNPDLYLAMRASLAQVDSGRQQYDQGRSSLAELNRILENAWVIVDFAAGFGTGVLEQAIDTAQGLWHVVAHPVDSADAVAALLLNTDGVRDKLLAYLADRASQIPDMSATEIGELTGRVALEISGFAVGVGWIKTGQTTVTMARAANLAAASYVKLVPVVARGLSRLERVAPMLLNGRASGREAQLLAAACSFAGNLTTPFA